jgi:DNA polymerase-3 subunit delta'
VIDNFLGNPAAVQVFEHMVRDQRISQTILLAGPEGVGKATLARRFAATLLGDPARIERDDLFLPENASIVADREKWTAEKRNEDPLLFSSHPDFVTFAPDGPLRQISIQQMRHLKEIAQYKPLRGNWRVFLIDHIDRANEQAANSLLKTLEEPPPHLVIIMTAENAYDLLPTIRSRSVIFQMSPLSSDDMDAFAKSRGLRDGTRRLALASGSPGVALSIDLEAYDKRRAAMLALLQVASSRAPFAKWTKYSESIGASKSEKLEYYLKILYVLLEDLLILHQTRGEIRNPDIRGELEAVLPGVTFEWLYNAIRKVDELAELMRRNIQKSIALDALIVSLRT